MLLARLSTVLLAGIGVALLVEGQRVRPLAQVLRSGAQRERA